MRKSQRLALWVAAPLALASGCANGPGLFSSSRHGQPDDAAQRMVQAAQDFDQNPAATATDANAKARPIKPSDLSRSQAMAQSASPLTRVMPDQMPAKEAPSGAEKPVAQQSSESPKPAVDLTIAADSSAQQEVQLPENWQELRKELLLDDSARMASVAEKPQLSEVTSGEQVVAEELAPAMPEKSEIPVWSLTEKPVQSTPEKSEAATPEESVVSTPVIKPGPSASRDEVEWTVEVVPAAPPKATRAAAVESQPVVTESASPTPKTIAEKPKSVPTDAELFPADEAKHLASKEDWTKGASASADAKKQDTIDKAGPAKEEHWAQLSEDVAFDDAPFAPPMEDESTIDPQSPFALAAVPKEAKVGQSDAPSVWADVVAQAAKPETPESSDADDVPVWATGDNAEPKIQTAAASDDIVWTRTAIDRLCPDLTTDLYPIVDQLGNGDSAAKLAALADLADRGEAAASADLAVRILLDDADPVVRAHAAATLRVIKRDAWDSVKTLRLLVFHPNPEVAKLVCYLLRGVGPEAMDAAPELRTLRDSKRGLVSLHAAEALLEITPHDAESVTCLVGASSSEDAGERAFAVAALGAVGQPNRATAVAALTKSLKDESENVRAAAALSLGGLGADAASARQALEQVAANDVPEVQEAAQIALDCLIR